MINNPFCLLDKICGKEFKSSSNYHVHERMHTGDKPYKCKFCECTFTSSGNRKEHHRRHVQRKLYSCKIEGCDKAYFSYNLLKMHTFRTHDLEITPKKKGVGGITKYEDVTSLDLNYELMEVDQTRLVKPIFQVEKCK